MKLAALIDDCHAANEMYADAEYAKGRCEALRQCEPENAIYRERCHDARIAADNVFRRWLSLTGQIAARGYASLASEIQLEGLKRAHAAHLAAMRETLATAKGAA